ncbi:winged helix-turn-helix transcriptional regulator [Amphiplicatus metriothermophilus]|uniref:Transcriptional regulator, HxlR family n=1 Tax=Amphiplicatus metriothermophilus TaxID=1519374 RepID=A0A239PJK5_9PROT|nr:helix-turn-helix domain-containing protein [Amphiplicatus metriothermophilus]MBB5517869.1 DNA-binding HxlR family transcriptional regulator [Amphiplicatus metriothermophilus]SNT67797.1 transcriptional regulator, HxlR family [Amphiplicatus metriothermophilus]
MSRTYNQDCVLAYALDLLGERWTMLIIRELFLGPRRFGDLHAALPGIGTNLLSKRLKELEEAGLIVGPGPGEARGSYRLSEEGENLRPTVHALMYWSIEYFMNRAEPSPPRECIYSNDLQPDSVALAIELFVNKCATPFSNYVLHLYIDENPYTFYFMNGVATARRGADAPAVARIDADVATLMQAMRSEIYLPQIRERAKLSGDETVLNHFLTSLSPGAAVAEEVARQIRARASQHA